MNNSKTKFKELFEKFIEQDELSQAITLAKSSVKTQLASFYNTLTVIKSSLSNLEANERRGLISVSDTFYSTQRAAIRNNVLNLVTDTLKHSDIKINIDSENTDNTQLIDENEDTIIRDDLWSVTTNIKREIFDKPELSKKYESVVSDIENILKFHIGYDQKELSNNSVIKVGEVEYHLKKEVGNGRKNIVYLCDKITKGKIEGEVIIKALKPENYFDKQARNRFFDSSNYQKQLNHRNILGISSSIQNDIESRIYFFEAPYYKSGSLRDFVLDISIPKNTEYFLKIRNIILEISDATKYLHLNAKNDVCAHCDICPSNILVDETKGILCDFDSALVSGKEYSKYQLSEIGTTPYYPRALRISEFWGDKSPKEKLVEAQKGDVYALAATLYFCIVREELSRREFISKLQSANWEAIIADMPHSEELKNFLASCLPEKAKNKIDKIDDFITGLRNVETFDEVRIVKKSNKTFKKNMIIAMFSIMGLILGALLPINYYKSQGIKAVKIEKTNQEKKLQNYLNWYAPYHEEVLKNRLVFLFDSTSQFRKNVGCWVDLLASSYENINSKIVDPNSIRAWFFKDSELGNINYLATDSFGLYKYDIGKVMWTDFTDTTSIKEKNIDLNQKIENVSNKIFSEITILLIDLPFRTSNRMNILNEKIGILDTAFVSTLFFIYFKTENNEQIMMRYPAYQVDASGLKKGGYTPKNRQWYIEANPTREKPRFNGLFASGETPKKRNYEIGISKPYVTVRGGLPNQRTIWIKVPLKDALNAEMIINVDLIMKGDYVGFHN